MEFSGEDFVPKAAKVVDAFSTEPKKGGRPTIPDNFLLGSRNRWLSFFEECWPEVGWSLLRVRKRRSSTIADVQKIFVPIMAKQRCESASLFLGDLPTVRVSNKKFIRQVSHQRATGSKLRFELQGMQTALPQLECSLREAAQAVSQSAGVERVTIAAELKRRAHLVWKNKQIETPIKRRECNECEVQVRAGEIYIYCSELLDFLHRGLRAVTPIKLARALAGLPDMRWRESDTRCSKMNEDQLHPAYPRAVFLTIERLCKRACKTRSQSRVESFRAALLKLPQSHEKNTLCDHWRDFRLAIEKVYKAKLDTGFIPYALTAAFLKNTNRPKIQRDNVLDRTEALLPQSLRRGVK